MSVKDAEDVVDTLEISSAKKAPAKYPKELLEPRKMFFEEYVKIFVGFILVVLFIALFIGIVWYFLIQLDATVFDSIMGEAVTEGTSNALRILRM